MSQESEVFSYNIPLEKHLCNLPRKKKICMMVRLYVGSFNESLRFLKKEQVQRLKENYAIMERKPSQH